jgi:uncharacterized protein DUF6670
MLGSLTHKTLVRLLGTIDRSRAEQGKPFDWPGAMVPHAASTSYGWTHYGVMIPDLPEPHCFFTIMSLVGATGTRAFDTDHALVDTPRRNATVVSGTAATHPLHFGSYAIGRGCEARADGRLVRFGEAVEIEGAYPEYRVRARYGEFELDVAVRNTDKVTWFMRGKLYDHFSLLSHYAGTIAHRGARADVAGRCTFEYAACVSPYLLRDRPLPSRLKVPLDYFTYQVINLDAGPQLLLSQVMVLGRPVATAAYLRSTDAYSQTFRDVDFEVVELQARPAVAPDGRVMRLPRRFRWAVRDAAGAPLLDLEGTVDTPFTYGLGAGYVGGYGYAGRYRGEPTQGRGYVEYIDVR